MDKRKPQTCIGCPLAEQGRGFLSSEGTGTNGVLIVGEAAGKHEAHDSLPFRPHAPAGGLLEKLLDLSRLKREDFTVFNVVNCQPPGNELAGTPYETAAVAHCKQYVDEVVDRVKPKMILALGKTAFSSFTDLPSKNILELRGFVLNSIYGIPIIGSYHPAFLLRGAFHLLGVALHDLRRSVQYARNGVPERIKTSYELSPTSSTISNYLDRLRADRSLAVAYDIETEGILGIKESEKWSEKKIIQIQFSSGIGEAIVLKWDGWQRDAAEEIMALPNPKWGWNDRLSDRPALRGYGVKLNGELHDLMNAHGHLQPGFVSSKDEVDGDKGVPAKLMSLQSCLSFYYPEEGPYKGMVQRTIDEALRHFSERFGVKRTIKGRLTEDALNWIKESTRVQDTLRYYGAKDADYTFRLGLKLFAALKKAGLW